MFLLGGCSLWPRTTAPVVTSQDVDRYQQRRAQLLQIQGWSLQARASTGGLIGITGNLRWRQNGEAFDIVVTSPLGGGIRAQGVPRDVVVTSAEGSFRTADPEAVFQQQLGFRFPLTRLRYWIIGVTDPGIQFSSRRVDQFGQLRDFVQDGWNVRYEEYLQTRDDRGAPGLSMPAIMTLSDGERTLKVIIDRWDRIN